MAFTDLSAAYDTVWRHGLMLKLAKTITSKTTVELKGKMLSNRQFQVFMGNKESQCCRMNDGLSQGNVLPPTLFNLYVNLNVGKKFQFSDYIAISCQSKDLTQGKETLNEDLNELNRYF